MIKSVAIDISAFIWSEDKFNDNSYPFWSLIQQKILLLDLFKKFRHRISIYMGDELLSQIWTSFPYRKTPTSTKDRNLRISLFLMNTSFQVYEKNDKQILSEPTQEKEYFSNEVKVEIRNLMHSIHNSESVTYFSFQSVYEGSNDLKTISSIQRSHKTYVIVDVDSVNDIQDSFFPKFDHHKKHDPENPWSNASRLRCIKNKGVPQNILNIAIFDNGKYYGYDEGNSVWIIFRSHKDNLYHGYEEIDENRIPIAVKKQK